MNALKFKNGQNKISLMLEIDNFEVSQIKVRAAAGNCGVNYISGQLTT
jgi:hypothetical protein